MSKIIKDYAERKIELLETAKKLFFSKGYEHTSVNDIITAVGIAKGTFYHYFKSKEDLLNELINLISINILTELKVIVNNRSNNAVDKLNQFFSYAGNYKLENKETIIVSTLVLYRPENILLRIKMEDNIQNSCSPLLATLINQGIYEGHFTTDFPDLLPHMLLSMGIHLRDHFALLLLNQDRTEEDVSQFCKGYAMYQDAIERILGAPKNSISFVSDSLIRSFLS